MAKLSLTKLEVTIEPIDIAANSRIEGKSQGRGKFFYVRSGVVAIITEQGRYLVPPEQGLWLTPDIVYQLVAVSQVQLLSFSFENKTNTALPKQCTVLQVVPFMQSLIDQVSLIATNEDKQRSLQLILQLLLEQLGLAAQLQLLLPAVKDQRLIAITRKQQKFPALKTDLVAWGKFVNSSPRTLSRLFKKETGITYSEWKQMLAIHIAIIELYLGESILTIANNLGYESSSAFIYMFKKQMGVTPSHFLNSL